MKMHCRMRYSFDFDLKICSGQVWLANRLTERNCKAKSFQVTTFFANYCPVYLSAVNS